MYRDNGGYDKPNEAKFSHELVSGAAAFEGMKLFEDHQRKEGQIGVVSPMETLLTIIIREAGLPRLRQGAACRLRWW